MGAAYITGEAIKGLGGFPGLETFKMMLSGFIGAMLSMVINISIIFWVRHREKEDKIGQAIQQMIMISIKYPYIEDDEFCNKWKSKKKYSTDELRYDNYCCFVFNIFEELFSYYKGSKKKVEDFLAIKELICRHQKWWKAPCGNHYNIDGYDEKFRKFINSYLE